MDHQYKINDFAIRSFRDVADEDYISARLSYRFGLIQQFHWQSLQAIEKYFKTIFLLNRIKAKNIGHDLDIALKKLNELPFEVKLSQMAIRFIDHLAKFGQYRYLERSYYIFGPKLVELDKTVWELRHYCHLINFDHKLDNGEVTNMLSTELEAIEKNLINPPNNYRIEGGHLESILDNKSNPSRPALIWQNAFFCNNRRKKVNVPTPFCAVNAPLSLHPEIIDEILKYVHLQGFVTKSYRKYYENKKQNEKN